MTKNKASFAFMSKIFSNFAASLRCGIVHKVEMSRKKSVQHKFFKCIRQDL